MLYFPWNLYLCLFVTCVIIFFHLLYSFTLEFNNVFESAVKSICNLCKYINDCSNFESDCILHCPLLFNETSSSVSSTLAMTLAAGSLLCSAFFEEIAQTVS